MVKDDPELAESKEVGQEDAPLPIGNESTDLSGQTMEQQARKGVDAFIEELQANANQDKPDITVPSDDDL